MTSDTVFRRPDLLTGSGCGQGQAADANIALLSAYLGHVSPADTYWYLSASPELMELAAARLAAAGGPR